MAKNRAKAANNRAKKAKERSRERLADRLKRDSVFKAKKETSLAHFVENAESGYEFWFLHGINFILSSYAEGVWDPIFPEVYQGKAVSRSEAFRRIMIKHFDDEKSELSDLGTKAILWSSLKPKEMFSLVVRARGAAWAAKENPKDPASPHVWEFLDKFMNTFLQTVNAKSITEDGKIKIDANRYGDYLPEAIAATVAERSGVNTPEV